MKENNTDNLIYLIKLYYYGKLQFNERKWQNNHCLKSEYYDCSFPSLTDYLNVQKAYLDPVYYNNDKLPIIINGKSIIIDYNKKNSIIELIHINNKCIKLLDNSITLNDLLVFNGTENTNLSNLLLVLEDYKDKLDTMKIVYKEVLAYLKANFNSDFISMFFEDFKTYFNYEEKEDNKNYSILNKEPQKPIKK